VALQDRIASAFAPATSALFAFADPQCGESALDVGCGCGATALELAHRVGPNAGVVGIDISRAMLAVAAQRAQALRLANIRFINADAATHAFGEPPCDLLFSQFGVMFFDDPARAFENLRRAVRDGGRVAFACWRGLRENPWFAVPLDAGTPLLPPQPPGPAHAPGPLSFADPAYVRGILSGARFADVALTAADIRLPLGPRAQAVDFLTQMGPLTRRLAGAEPAVRDAVLRAVDGALRQHETAGAVELGGGIWLVSARAA
jgi:SAM-dependent methyltransferase